MAHESPFELIPGAPPCEPLLEPLPDPLDPLPEPLLGVDQDAELEAELLG